MVRYRPWLAALLGLAALLNLAPFLYQVGLSLAPLSASLPHPGPSPG